MRYHSLRRRARHFKTFTGMTVEEFDAFAVLLRPIWEQSRVKRLIRNRPDRTRTVGGGRKFALQSFEDKLLLTMVWSKLYPTHVLLEYLFGVDESTVCRTIRSITALSRNRFPLDGTRKRIGSIEELKALIPDLDDILMDATEQVVRQPAKKRERKTYHSGKKRAYTVKTQIATSRGGRILHVSKSIGGRAHDLNLLRRSGFLERVPHGIPIYGDAGYDGIGKDYPDHVFRLPFRRFRAKPTLSRSEKIANTKQRRTRTPVEHVFSRFKKYAVLSERYRHARHAYGNVFRFVAAMVDFRTACRLTAV